MRKSFLAARRAGTAIVAAAAMILGGFSAIPASADELQPDDLVSNAVGEALAAEPVEQAEETDPVAASEDSEPVVAAEDADPTGSPDPVEAGTDGDGTEAEGTEADGTESAETGEMAGPRGTPGAVIAGSAPTGFASALMSPMAAAVAVLSVSPSSELDPAGASFTVTGTGYEINTGGIYAQVGWIIEGAWTPISSEDTRSDNREDAKSAWIGSGFPGQPAWTVAEDGSGSFTWNVTVTKAELDAVELAGGTLAVFTLGAHGNWVQPANERFVPISFADPAPVAELVVSPSSGLDPAGASFTVTGTGYEINTGGIYAQVGWIIEGAWTPISSEDTRSDNREDAKSAWIGSGYPGQPAWTVAEDGSGSFTWNVTVTKAELDAVELAGGTLAVFTLGAHGNWVQPANERFVPISFADADGGPGTGPGPGDPGDPGPGDPGPSDPGAAAPAVSVNPASINPAFGNTVVVSGSGFTGAGAASGVYVSFGAASVWQPGQVPNEGDWLTTVWVTPGQLSGGAFSTTLRIPPGALSLGTSYGVATFAAHGLSRTDRSLDTWTPVSLSAGALATVSNSSDANRQPASTPPSTSGATVDKSTHQAGGRITITAGGFQPHETGILVVLYSDPVVLARNATADANGLVTWSGVLPRGITGAHTLTLQGSVSAGTPISITAATAERCTIDDATLTWGFKETFRSYITSTIANGEWTVADGAEYETPNFIWSGAGSLDPEQETGDLAFTGSVRFTGHDGVLDTTIADPRIVLTSTGASILLDVTGTTQDGQPVEALGIEFATLDLAAATPEADGDTLVWSAIPATLTAAGAEAFGTYPAGEALDPVALTVTLPTDCGETAAAGEPSPEVTTMAPVDDGATDGPDLSWIWWLIGGVVLLAIVIAIVVMLVRRRAA